MTISTELAAHLQTGATTLCRAWALSRKDGITYGFTDHDLPLEFEGITFRADSGLAARALQHATGLAVDNTEAVGVLSDAALREEDIQAGRYDGADVRAWLVNWKDVSQRVLQFRGTLGEITRGKGAFTAELRGLTESLNQPEGRSFQSPCSAVLGDPACGFDVSQPGYHFEDMVEQIEDRKIFKFTGLTGFGGRWFEGGRFRVISGSGAGLIGLVKSDRLINNVRRFELWEAIGAEVVIGDTVRFEVGCDKRGKTCRDKFNNIVNFRGFPHIPGDDWMMAYPSSRQPMTGESLQGDPLE